MCDRCGEICFLEEAVFQVLCCVAMSSPACRPRPSDYYLRTTVLNPRDSILCILVGATSCCLYSWKLCQFHPTLFPLHSVTVEYCMICVCVREFGAAYTHKLLEKVYAALVIAGHDFFIDNMTLRELAPRRPSFYG